MTGISIHPAVLGAIFTFIFLLISLGIGNLLYRVRKIENETVSTEMMETKLELVDTKINALKDSIEQSDKRNAEDHKTIFSVLEDIRDCVTKLANGKTEC